VYYNTLGVLPKRAGREAGRPLKKRDGGEDRKKKEEGEKRKSRKKTSVAAGESSEGKSRPRRKIRL